MNRNLDTRPDDSVALHSLGGIAYRLSTLAAECAALGFNQEGEISPSPLTSSLEIFQMGRSSDLAQRAHNYLAARRARCRIIDGDWFSDPAWDLLLDLFAEQSLGNRVSITSACIAANVPSTTALRWIEKLVQHGFLIREDDPTDRRRTYLSMAPALAARLEQWIDRYLPPICQLEEQVPVSDDLSHDGNP